MNISERDKTFQSFIEFLKTLPRNRQIAILRSVYLKVEAGTAVIGDFLDAMSYEEKAYFNQRVLSQGNSNLINVKIISWQAFRVVIIGRMQFHQCFFFS
jgi:hypothetical protein